MALSRPVLPRPVPVPHLPAPGPADPVVHHGSPPAQRVLPLRRAA